MQSIRFLHVLYTFGYVLNAKIVRKKHDKGADGSKKLIIGGTIQSPKNGGSPIFVLEKKYIFSKIGLCHLLPIMIHHHYAKT